jgi:hypothetical protein
MQVTIVKDGAKRKDSYRPNKNIQVQDQFKLHFTLKLQNSVLHWTGAQFPRTMQWTVQKTWKIYCYILFHTNKTNFVITALFIQAEDSRAD